MSYLPNIITLFRIGMAPLLLLLFKDHQYVLAFYVFIIAGLSDALDGFIAKRFGYVSQLGAILDPLADKLLVVTSYVMLSLDGHVPFWLLLTVVFRDLLIVAGYLIQVSMFGATQMRPSYASKLNTFMQIFLVVVILGTQAFNLSMAAWIEVLIVVVFLTTVVSGLHYLWILLVKREVAND